MFSSTVYSYKCYILLYLFKINIKYLMPVIELKLTLEKIKYYLKLILKNLNIKFEHDHVQINSLNLLN